MYIYDKLKSVGNFTIKKHSLMYVGAIVILNVIDEKVRF